MPINDDIAEAFTPYVVDLTRYDAALRRKVLKILRQLQSDIVQAIERADPTAPARTAFQQRRLAALTATVNKTIAEAFKDINKQLKGDYIRLGKLSSQNVLNTINSTVGVELATVTLAPEALTLLASNFLIEGAKSADWWKEQDKALRFKFKSEMQMGMARGETLYQLMRRVRGTRAGGFTDGIMQGVRRNAETLVRTSVINLNNDATLATYQANGDIISGVAWLATLDTRTTHICAALDGLAWDLNYEPIGHTQQFPGPTAHWGCRSTQTPIIRGVDDLPPRKRKGIPEGTRASMDGQVPEAINFDKWLRKQGKSRIVDILGPKRYAIWKEHNLSMTDLVDQYNNPLTIDQLEARYG